MNTTPGHAELLLHAQDLYLGNKVHRLLYHICLHTCSSVEWICLEGAVQSQLRHSHSRMRWTLILISDFCPLEQFLMWHLSLQLITLVWVQVDLSEHLGGKKTHHGWYKKDILSCLHSQHCSKTRNTWAGEVRAHRQTLSVISTAQMAPTIKSTGSIWFWHHSFLIAAAMQDALGETKPGKPS